MCSSPECAKSSTRRRNAADSSGHGSGTAHLVDLLIRKWWEAVALKNGYVFIHSLHREHPKVSKKFPSFSQNSFLGGGYLNGNFGIHCQGFDLSTRYPSHPHVYGCGGIRGLILSLGECHQHLVLSTNAPTPYRNPTVTWVGEESTSFTKGIKGVQTINCT